MPNRPKNQIMGFSEMVEENAQRASSRLFSKDIDVSEKITNLVNNARRELSEMPTTISLGDTKTVKVVTERYLESCAIVGVVPTKSGVCRGFGCSRQAVTDFMNKHPNHGTTKYLSVVFDLFSEILADAALAGSTHPIISIFLLKSIFGYRDTQTVEFIPPETGPLGEEISAEEIAAKYADLPAE